MLCVCVGDFSLFSCLCAFRCYLVCVRARYYDLKPADLGELVKLPRMGKTLHRLVHQFPRVELAASVQPITRGLLRVELTITPDFLFDQKVLQNGGGFCFVALSQNSSVTVLTGCRAFIRAGCRRCRVVSLYTVSRFYFILCYDGSFVAKRGTFCFGRFV